MKQVLFLQNLYGGPDEVRWLLKEAKCFYEIAWPDDTAPPASDVAVLVTKEHHLDAATMEQYPNLEMASLGFTGYDQVDLDYASNRGIHVYYVPAYATDSVAELVLGLTLAIFRKIPESNRAIRYGSWDKLVIPGRELSGKTVGILGTGTIGCRTAELFHAFGCRLLGCSRTKMPQFESLGGTYIDQSTLFRDSDVIAVCLAANKATRNCVGIEDLVRMKDGAVLVNAARNDIVNQDDLATALSNRPIFAGIDVFSNEPDDGTDPLLGLENVVATPHIGFKTHEALTRLTQQTIENIGRFLVGDSTNRLTPQD